MALGFASLAAPWKFTRTISGVSVKFPPTIKPKTPAAKIWCANPMSNRKRVGFASHRTTTQMEQALEWRADSPSSLVLMDLRANNVDANTVRTILSLVTVQWDRYPALIIGLMRVQRTWTEDKPPCIDPI